MKEVVFSSLATTQGHRRDRVEACITRSEAQPLLLVVRPSSIFHKHFDAFSHLRSHPMCESLGVADALFDAAVGALDGVTVVGHGVAGGFVDEFELAAEGGREEGVVDDDDRRR